MNAPTHIDVASARQEAAFAEYQAALANARPLAKAAALVRQAAALVEQAETLLVGHVQLDDASSEYWIAEGSLQHDALSTAIDAYHFYLTHNVSVKPDRGLAA